MSKKLIVLFSVVTLILLFVSFSFLKNEQVERDLELFSSFYRTLNEHYVDSIHSDKLIKRVIDATSKSLDPFTVFYDAEQTKERENAWAGIQYAGIGATIQLFDSLVYVTELIDGYPAQLAGLKIGDAFIKINDTIVAGKDLSIVRSKLIGEKNTPLKILVKRENKLLAFDLTRKEVVSLAVDIAFIDTSGIGYIRLNHFLRNSSKVFKQQLDSLAKHHSIKKIVIDLRQNSGGIVDESVEILGCFLPLKTEVCFLRGFHKDANYSYYTNTVNPDTIIPITILISNQTISAGEIFAGAMQDLDRAVIIGERTYGKGFVQGTRFPGNGSSLYLTAARYFTPSGRCIQERKYAADITTSTYNDTTKVFYTKKGKAVKANGGVEPDINYKTEVVLNLKQIFSEKEVFFYLNKMYSNYLSTKDTLLFINNESDKLIDFLSLNLSLIHHPAEYELKRFEEKMKEHFSNKFYQEEVKAISQKINREKMQLLRKYKNEINKELQAQIIKRKYGKLQEELFRIRTENDLWQQVLNKR